jgi:hypothetical protein
MMAAQVAVERVAFLERVREISCMLLGLEVTYRDWSGLFSTRKQVSGYCLKFSLPATRPSNNDLLITLSFKLVQPEVVITR